MPGVVPEDVGREIERLRALGANWKPFDKPAQCHLAIAHRPDIFAASG